MNKTKIEYLTHTWNPIAMQCTPVSEGCKNCWSLAINKRFKNKPEKPELIDKELDAPMRLKKPARIGVQFMGDLFHESVPFEWIDKVIAVIALCPQHQFQILTKREEIMLEYFRTRAAMDDSGRYNCLPQYYQVICDWLDDGCKGFLGKYWDTAEKAAEQTDFTQPLNNLWLGVTCENKKATDERIPILLSIPSAVRFLSLEPLLEQINFDIVSRPPYFHTRPYGWMQYFAKYIHWVIIGCESGPNRRPCKLEWVRSIVDQCKSAGVPVFIKQLDINGKVEHDNFPVDLRIRKYP